MTTYESLGVRPIINAYATLTRLGGSLMPPEVLQAMNEAAAAFIDLHELQRRVGDRLAEITHNEAAYVSCGAAAGLVLAAASCIAGSDPDLIRRFPDLTGMKNEIIVHKRIATATTTPCARSARRSSRSAARTAQPAPIWNRPSRPERRPFSGFRAR